jgi:hypothetical protein
MSPADALVPDLDAIAVSRAAHAYEQALVDGDRAAATAWFDGTDDVSRFGPEGAQWGPAAVAALRAATAATPVATWTREEAVGLADGVVLHLAELQRGATTIQRTQVWRRTAAGWRIAHAHVSRPVSS